MKRQIEANILSALLGVAFSAESSRCPTVLKGVQHRKTNFAPLARSALSFHRAGFLWWILSVCLFVPLTRSSAQVRLGLQMPSLVPQQVAATDTAPPSLTPGETLTFTMPDAVGGTNNPAVIGLAGNIASQTPLRAFAYSVVPLQSSSASAFQYNDFAIPVSTVPGGVADSVVSAQISGSVSVRGFLFAMGASEATAGVNVEVLDITDTNAPPQVVSSQSIAEYEADAVPSGSVGGSVTLAAQAGFPYVGLTGGGSISGSLRVGPSLQFVRDDKTFGFMVLLRRGHVYRVQTDLSVDTSERVFGGTAIASFYSAASGGPVIPNALDPQPTAGTPGAENSWLSLLDPMAGSIPDLQIAKGEADVVSRSLSIAGITYDTSIWNNSADQVTGALFGFLSKDQKAVIYHGHDLLNVLSPKLPLTMDGLVMNSPFLADRNEGNFETIPLPGVAVAGPTITLGNDVVGLAEQATDRTIEENLSSGDLLVSLYLPAAFGGELERCTALVTSLIAESKAAGYDTSEAGEHLAFAVKEQGEGEYKMAFEQLHEAYAGLTMERGRFSHRDRD